MVARIFHALHHLIDTAERKYSSRRVLDVMLDAVGEFLEKFVENRNIFSQMEQKSPSQDSVEKLAATTFIQIVLECMFQRGPRPLLLMDMVCNAIMMISFIVFTTVKVGNIWARYVCLACLIMEAYQQVIFMIELRKQEYLKHEELSEDLGVVIRKGVEEFLLFIGLSTSWRGSYWNWIWLGKLMCLSTMCFGYNAKVEFKTTGTMEMFIHVCGSIFAWADTIGT